MFSIVITDKGGAQRRLNLDKGEVTIGRVQGNDIILPKGNVSKRHSRIVFKDNRYIVVDLKSTNGTYVNGRKITSPLVIRPSDKIYIGDFILTLEDAGQQASPSASEAASARPNPVSLPPPLPPASVAPPLDVGVAAEPGRGPTKQIAGEDGRRDAAPAFAPSPPLGSAPGGVAGSAAASAAQSAAARGRTRTELAMPQFRERAATPHTAAVEARPAVAPTTPDVSIPGGLLSEHGAGTAFELVMQRVGRLIDLRQVTTLGRSDIAHKNSVEAVVHQVLAELSKEGGIDPAVVDSDALAAAALQEAVGLGALEPLLADEQVTEIVVEAYDRVAADFGRGLMHTGRQFSSRAALLTAISRLLGEVGEQLDPSRPVHEVLLNDGRHAVILLPPVTVQGPLVQIRAAARPIGRDALIEARVLDASVFQLLQHAIERRRNIVVVGPAGAGVSSTVANLLAMANAAESLVTVQAKPNLVVDQKHVAALRLQPVGAHLSSAEVIRQAANIRADRLVIDGVHGPEMLEALLALAARAGGDILGLRAAPGGNVIEQMRGLAAIGGTMEVAALEQLIGHAVHVYVQVARTASGYRLQEVGEVLSDHGRTAVHPLFRYDNGFNPVGQPTRI